MVTFKISSDDDGVRFDRILRKKLALMTLSDIYRLIRTGRCRVNGKKSTQEYRVRANDVVELDVDASEMSLSSGVGKEVQAGLQRTDFYKRNLKIIYEDDDLLACNKPPNLVVHPGTGHSRGDTLIDLVAAYMSAKGAGRGAPDPTLVHRIDRDTSGIILIAKNKRVLRFLHTHFRDHQIEKKYFAICHGRPQKSSGTIEVNLAKTVEHNTGMKMRVDEEGDFSQSDYSIVRTTGKLSLLQVVLKTGKTHQIRVHLEHIGCPIAGDIRYGNQALDQELFARKGIMRRLYLHASSIGFVHPLDNKKLTLSAPLPDEFEELMRSASTK
jgi:23S rRNA pseudouridine955/2504/2580 synthase